MTSELGPGFCGACGDTFTTTAALDAHQMETGHEMNQPDHPLRQEPVMSVPAFTACPGGHITATPLPDGRILIEGWILNLNPYDSDRPRTDPACHWIADNEKEAAETIAEFTNDLATPITA